MRPPLAFVIVALGVTYPAVARGQNSDVTRADTLFNAAKALLDAGQYVDACAKFAESKRLAPGLGVTLYLADCYERIGRTASAWAEFRSAEGLARQRSDKRADVARGRAQALEPKLERLTVTVAPTVPRSGLEVLRDGVQVPPEEWGIAMPVDPGDHVVLVSSPGHPQRTIAARVDANAPNATVRIDSLEENPTAPALPPPSPTTPSPASASSAPSAAPTPTSTPAATGTPTESSAESAESNPGAARRWIGLGVLGAGVVGLGVGTAFGLVAKSKLDQSNNGPCDATDHCDNGGLTLRQSASNAASVSTIAFVAGGVGAAAGVVLYLTAPRASQTSAFVLSPAPVAGGGAALLRGTF